MKKLLLGLLALSSVQLVTAAENTCSQYMLKPVQGKDFNFYYQKAKALNLPPKDEFETTAQYKERLDKAYNSLNVAPEFFVEIPIDRDQIKFDADQRMLTFGPYVINNATVSYGDKFKTLMYGNSYTGGSAYDIQISRELKKTGTYIAQNALGAKFEIQKQEVTHRSITDQPKTGAPYYPRPPLGVFNIDQNNISIEKIKALKAGAKAYALISLKPPFAVKTSSPPESPTTRIPFATTTINEALFADIKCFIITDENNIGLISSILDTKLGDQFVKEEEIRLRKARRN